MECESCGAEYAQISNHWRQSDCEYPTIDQETMGMLRGLLMGDGHIKNRYMSVTSVTEPFLEWLDSELGVLSNGHTLSATASELAERNRHAGYNVNEDNYNDQHVFRTVSHPEIGEMRDVWYGTGEKRFPDDLELTPTTARMWYVTDGHYADSRGKRRPLVSFAVSNEDHRGAYLRSLFAQQGFDATLSGHSLRLSADHSEKFLNWIGKPVPGFEYKWGDV